MLHWLKRHPFAVRAFFRQCLVIAYSFPEKLVRPLLPPGLILDTFEGHGFVAIALVQTEDLRPALLPRGLGANFFLSGYRIFTRLHRPSGAYLRGLRILRSDTDRRMMQLAGNQLTHYNYHLAQVEIDHSPKLFNVRVTTPDGSADLDVSADLTSMPASLPPGSIFGEDLKAARHFAGPLPFTFDYERETNSIIAIKGVRSKWDPQLLQVDVRRCSFLDQEPFRGQGTLASAFYVSEVPYMWRRGVRMKILPAETAASL